jgi:hypothetical protein
VAALGERSQHGPAADAHDVGGHVAQLDVGALEHLLEPAHHVRALVDQPAQVADELAAP